MIAAALALSVASTLTMVPGAGASQAAANAADPIAGMLKRVSEARIRARIDKLVAFETRNTFSETQSETRGIGAARRWIQSDLEESSRASGGRLQVKTLSTKIARKGGADPEVVDVYGFLPGKSAGAQGRTYLVSGHYDSMAGDAKDATSLAPGADDDASGTAVVLELARVLSQQEFEANLVFQCVAGEEQGLWGSTDFAAYCEKEKIALDGVITNDIVGGIVGGDGARDDKTVRCFSGGETVHDPARELARSLYDAAHLYVPNAAVRLVFRLDRFHRGGDHIPFHNMKVPALRITEAVEDYRHQHKGVDAPAGLGDLPEHVSEAYVARVARVDGALLASVALAPPAPTEVKLRGAVRYDTQVEWKGSPGAAGYVVVWRETTSPVWQKKSDVIRETQVVLPVIADNYFFGVRAVDAVGHESRTAIASQP